MTNLYLLLGRAALGFILISSGLGRLLHYAAAQQSIEALGMSAALLPLVIAIEVGGGTAILCGAYARLAAAGLALFSLLAGLLLYGDFTDQNQFIELSKRATMAGGFLMLLATGPGAFSVDTWRRKPRPKPIDDCVVCG